MKSIIPENEGESVSVTIRVPAKLLAWIDRMAKATNNSRTEVILHGMRWVREQVAQEEAESAAAKE